MSRPRKEEIEKRQVQVNIRLTKDEADTVDSYAIASGLSPANWIRQKVFTGRFPNLKQSPINAALFQELKKIGVNINQIAHKVNLGEMPGPYLRYQLELLNKLDKIFKLLTDDRQTNKG
ncbi:MAG TPA: plasmid mobilization relaxosome protein MobC [Cyclobacteriaceae bacterium]|nr:plasmid mobilization relaxosome protein MobC [Cyclobacteriaceae bacterium]